MLTLSTHNCKKIADNSYMHSAFMQWHDNCKRNGFFEMCVMFLQKISDEKINTTRDQVLYIRPMV